MFVERILIYRHNPVSGLKIPQTLESDVLIACCGSITQETYFKTFSLASNIKIICLYVTNSLVSDLQSKKSNENYTDQY